MGWERGVSWGRERGRREGLGLENVNGRRAFGGVEWSFAKEGKETNRLGGSFPSFGALAEPLLTGIGVGKLGWLIARIVVPLRP